MVKAKEINRRCVILGFGGVAKPVCHIFATRYSMREYIIVDKKRISDDQIKIFGNKPVSRLEFDIKPEELFDTINYILKDNDIVCDFFGCNETLDIIHACHLKNGIVYVNASLEENLAKPYPTQNAIYQAFFEFKKKFKPTISGCIDAGANPGLITHFCILGIYSMAKEAINNKIADYEKIQFFLDKKDIPSLAQPESFHDEWTLETEVSMGTHDIEDLSQKMFQKIPLSEPPAVQCFTPIYLKTASPDKIFTGKVVRHPETIEISQIFSNEEHVPTVAFVYRPTRLTRQDLENKNWKELPTIVVDESTGGPLTGSETMGATLISSRKDIMPRWFGSVITCEQEREIGANSNPTTLQVAAGVISHLLLSLEEPEKGLCMPHEFDSEKILQLAKPFLGNIIDKSLPFRLPTKWSELVSTKEEMDTDLIISQ